MTGVTAKDIYKAAPIKVVKFDIGGGVKVTLKALSIAQREIFLANKTEDTGQTFAELIAMSCVELGRETHQQILSKLDPNVIMAIGNKIVDISGMSVKTEKKA